MSAQKRTTVRGNAVEPAASDAVERRARPPKPEEKQPGVWAVRKQRIRGSVQETISEMKKITWPDSETTRNLTIVVIGISIAMGIILGGVDWILVQILGLF